VLEAGSALGFMVYPPLEPNESYHVEFQGDGRYQFVYFNLNPRGKWDAIFSVTITLPVGTLGMIKEEVAFMNANPGMTREDATLAARTFIVPEDMGTPGALALRGSMNFQTPPGWDTAYTPIFNMIDRPVVPMLVIRVETGWVRARDRVPLRAGAGRRHSDRTRCRSDRSSVPRGDDVPRPPTRTRGHQESQSSSRGQGRRQGDDADGMPYSPHHQRRAEAGPSVRPSPSERGSPRRAASAVAGQRTSCP
jgi:hypothetical protein